MAPLKKPKSIKKASETAAASPIAGRTRATTQPTTTPTLQEIMEGLQSFLAPQLAALKTDVVESLTASVNDRFLDLENNLDQIESAVESQDQGLQDQLRQAIQRLEFVEQENHSLRVSSQQFSNPNPNVTSPSSPGRDTNAFKYAHILSSQDPTPVAKSSSTSHSKEYDDPLAGTPLRGGARQRGSVVGLHFPNLSVVAILVHNDYYANKARHLLQAKRLEPINNFDPYHHSHLGDPEFKNKPIEERTARMKEITDKQYYTTIEGLHERNHVQLVVARHFHRQNKISTQYLQDLIEPSTPSNNLDTNAQSQPPTGELFNMAESEVTSFQRSFLS